MKKAVTNYNHCTMQDRTSILRRTKTSNSPQSLKAKQMPKAPNNVVPKKNSTEEKLRATPFSAVDALDLEENAIRLSVWRRFTESKVFEELLTKPEFRHILEELKAGLSCSMNSNLDKDLFRIYSDGRGLRLEVNDKMAASMGEHQRHIFHGLIQTGIEGYGALHMQAKGVVTKPSLELKDKDRAQGKPPPQS
jgi:hypothetical protein